MKMLKLIIEGILSEFAIMLEVRRNRKINAMRAIVLGNKP
jgi:hypothetical protein